MRSARRKSHAPNGAPPRTVEPSANATPVQVQLVMLFILTLLAGQASAGNKVRGIDPNDLSYFQGDNIWCKDGSKSFPRERLNDNFCDCPDGTDEPGTSACPAGKYYCRNSGSAPESVFASRVNDGICDCCDGSDEYEKRVDCGNICEGADNESNEKLEEGLGRSTTLNTGDGFEDIPHHRLKKFGEDLVSKLKGVTQSLFSCWKSNYHSKIICMLGCHEHEYPGAYNSDGRKYPGIPWCK